MDTRFVVATPRNNKVGKLLGRFDELVVHGLQHVLIAFKHHIDRTSTLYNIATDITNQSYIGIRIHKNLQIHHIAQLLIVQRHDALEDNNGLGFYMDSFWQTVAKHIWGGEGGAFLIDRYLVPELFDIYTETPSVKLMMTKKVKFQEKGRIRLYQKFWKGIIDEKTAPKILIYADLMGSGNSRCIEAAQRLIENGI